MVEREGEALGPGAFINKTRRRIIGFLRHVDHDGGERDSTLAELLPRGWFKQRSTSGEHTSPSEEGR